MFDNYPDMLTPKQVQYALSIGRTKVYELLRSGELRSITVGRQRRVPKKYLVDYLQNIMYNTELKNGAGDEEGSPT